MKTIELFRRYFSKEYPNEHQFIVNIEEHLTFQDTKWVKIIFKTPELRQTTLESYPELLSFSDTLAKTLDYSGVIIGSMTQVLELYFCGGTESKWYEPGLSGSYGTSGFAGFSGMTYYTEVTTTNTINPCREIELPEIRETRRAPIQHNLIRKKKKWHHKLFKQLLK